LTAIGA